MQKQHFGETKEMFYHIFYALHDIWTPFNVFQYITFRAGGAILTSLIICFILGPFTIRKLANLKINQVVRSDGLQTHIRKSSTPTMGGVLLLFSVVVSALMWTRLNNRFVILLLLGSLWLGILGFLDDYLKFKYQNSKGLSPKLKLFWQALFSVIIAVYLYLFPQNLNFSVSASIPFFKGVFVNFSYLYMLFVILIIVGSSNSVNLTDGLDGLASGNILIAALTFAVFAYLAGHYQIANYLKIIHVAGAGEVTVFLFGIIGAMLGFLWYNAHPAQIFMGDTGSLFLGGILGMSAIFIKQELVLPIAGGVFLVEALSVLVQVYCYKKTGKRIFKMAPLHHHFELNGLSEPKVTIRFWIIGIILAIISLATLKLR